jgi:Fe-S oxidoreductase/nitrate reductase gamma subunit
MYEIKDAVRPIMWNISGAWVMYLLVVVALGLFAYGAYRRWAHWREGKPDEERFSDWGRRLLLLLKELVFQKRVRSSRFPGLFHSLIFYSFLVLAITTAVVALDYDFGTTLFKGWVYVALTVASELAGVFILVGVGMAAARRLFRRPESLPSTGSDLWALALVAALVLTGYATEGLRIATLGDPWAWLTPVGGGFARLWGSPTEETGRQAHQVLWWGHTVLALGWIASIPYTKFAHLLSLPTNVLFSKLRPRGELKRVDVMKMLEAADVDESQIQIGVQKPTEFTWKQRLDFDACVSCGRCDEICPAVMAGHPFSPRRFVASCKDLVAGSTGLPTDGDPAATQVPDIVGTAFDEEFIWYCRTCTACMEVCPAKVEHVDSLIEIRRNEIMMQGRIPTDAARALKSLESLGNPFGPQVNRVDWMKQMGLRIVGPGEECDVLYWAGCCVAFDPTKQRMATDLVRLLAHCGIEFGVLGADERCCADPARLLGEERLFQEMARRQVEELNKRKFKVLLTSCPHCYNALKNEFPQFGGNYRVVHHSEFIHEMLWNGELRPRFGESRTVTYHDPCYLGRYQGQYDSPRQVLEALPGTRFVEMENSRDKSLCCGGGGGHFWMDLKKGRRINNLRVQQALDARAEVIVTGCAYCMQMLSDSIKTMDAEDRLSVADLSTLALRSVGIEPTRDVILPERKKSSSQQPAAPTAGQAG